MGIDGSNAWAQGAGGAKPKARRDPGAKTAKAAAKKAQDDGANELLNQIVRVRVGEATARIREYTLAKAFFSDPGRSTIDALLAELDAEELDEDPLEIEVPWETPADG